MTVALTLKTFAPSPEQQRVINHRSGHLQVVACAVHTFAVAEKELVDKSTGRRAIGKRDNQADGVLFRDAN
jgi:hypothetical protein